MINETLKLYRRYIAVPGGTQVIAYSDWLKE